MPSPGSHEEQVEWSRGPGFKISDIQPCADNDELIYLEGKFENITLASLCEVLTKKKWNTLIMRTTGSVVGRLDGMILILKENLTFHLSNSSSEEEALRTLSKIIG